MKSFQHLLNLLLSSRYKDEMVRSVAPLFEFIGINHLWYYRITNDGKYTFVGSHLKWIEYCLESSLLSSFACLSHPNNIKAGIEIMKATEDEKYKEVMQDAWNKFGINFNINVIEKTHNGIEAFGFASNCNDVKSDERIINNLPILKTFISAFKVQNKKVFELISENPINLPSIFGENYFENSKEQFTTLNRQVLLSKLGFKELLELTAREIDVLKYMLHGYPSSYIAENLKISKKTVENYLATIKCKLGCENKVKLIEKARTIDSLGGFGL